MLQCDGHALNVFVKDVKPGERNLRFQFCRRNSRFFQGPLDPASFTRCQQSMCESNNQDQRAIGLYGLAITQNLKYSFSALSTDRVSSLAAAPKIVNLHEVFYSLKAGKCQSQRSTRLDHTTLLACGSSLPHP